MSQITDQPDVPRAENPPQNASHKFGITNQAQIMVVEDERVVARDIAGSLSELGYTITATVATGADAIQKARELHPHLVLMDIRLRGDIDGVQAAECIWREHAIPIIFLTANSDDETLLRALHTEPHGYLVKPFRLPELRCAIEIALHKHHMAAQLQEREQWLMTTLRSIGDAVVATDVEQKIKFINPAAEQLTGWLQEAAVGQAFSDVVQLITAITHEPVNSPLQQALQDKSAVYLSDDTLLVAKGGGALLIDDSAAPIVNDSGTVLGGVMVFRDVTEQRRMEQEVQRLNLQLERRVIERTTQLEAANRELEAFSYSVAHDLRTPLRAIDGFSQLLIDEHSSGLDARALNQLSRIRSAAQRMGQLIDALLRLAHVARHSLKKQHIDPLRIAREVAAELQSANPERQVHCLVTGEQPINGDKDLFKIVFENLLGNAWKFTAAVAHPHIEVGCILQQGERVFFVRDNGVGFDMQYAHKIFGAFQRLHSLNQYEGTGIGLAIVERIIHRHGGKIWVDSAIKKGTTIYFSV